MNTDPSELLRHGDLAGARRALVEIVKSQPNDAQARMFLFQLLALLGEWDKARLQLNTLAQLSPEAQMLSVAYGQAIDAERERAKAWAGVGPVKVHAADEGWPLALASAIGHLARGEVSEGEAARDAAFAEAGDTPGQLDGVEFEWIANSDSRLGPAFEAIIGGVWGIVPFDRVSSITSSGVRDLRDLVWYPVEIMFRSGQSAAALLPARYPLTEAEGTDAERLGRATSWEGGASGDQPSGQQLFMLSGGEEIGLLDLRNLTFT